MIPFFKKKAFKPQNGFSALVLVTTENQIKYQKLKYSQGKLECYIFYSTYISILTSTLYPKYADKVDQLLVNGIWGYRDFLKIEDYPQMGFPEYVESRGKLFLDCIKDILPNIEEQDNSVIPTFVMLFETNEIIDLDEVNMSDLFKIMSAFQIVNSNFELIKRAYNQCAIIENFNIDLISDTFSSVNINLINQLVAFPFQKPRCQGCGSFKNRDELKLATVQEEDGYYSLPMCHKCKAKYEYQDENSI